MPHVVPSREGPEQRRPVQRLFIFLFGVLVIAGFAGIFWTVQGAPGHDYYWKLRIPITACVLVGGTGFLFSTFPLLVNLVNSGKTVIRCPKPSDQELKARADVLCSRLPQVEYATWKTKLSFCLVLVAFISGAFYGLRTARPALVILSSLSAIFFVWQLVRALVYRVEFYAGHIWYRTFRGSQTRTYADVLEVGPGYSGNEIRTWFSDQTKLTIYADKIKRVDILLIVTARQIAEPQQ